MKFAFATVFLALPIAQADNGAFEIVSPAEVKCPDGKRCCPAPSLENSNNVYTFTGFEGEGYCEEGCSQDGMSVEVLAPSIATCPEGSVRCYNEAGSPLSGTGIDGKSIYENLGFGSPVRCDESCDIQESKLFVGPATIACPEGAIRCYQSDGYAMSGSGNSTHTVFSLGGFFAEARCSIECTVDFGNKVFVGPALVDCGGRGNGCATVEGLVNTTTDPETGNWYWLVEPYGEEARCFDDCVGVFNSTETIGPAEVTCPLASGCMLSDGSMLNATSVSGDEAFYALHKATPETVRCDDKCSVRESMETIGPARVECKADGTFGCGSNFDDIPAGTIWSLSHQPYPSVRRPFFVRSNR